VSNPAVDVNSRAGLTCYPRGSFYPLSPAFLQRAVGSLSPAFAPIPFKKGNLTHLFWLKPKQINQGAACPPCCQAGFCLYTFNPISIRVKPTFELLHYLLGGFYPRKTAHQTLSFNVFAAEVRFWNLTDGCFIGDSIPPASGTSQSPRYATQPNSKTNVRLQ